MRRKTDTNFAPRKNERKKKVGVNEEGKLADSPKRGRKIGLIIKW